MPVITASRSFGMEPLLRHADPAGRVQHLTAQVRVGERHDPERELGLCHRLAVRPPAAPPSPRSRSRRAPAARWPPAPGRGRRRRAASPRRPWRGRPSASNRARASSSQPPVWAMVSIISTPGSSGWPGKCPSNTGLASGTRQSARTVPAAGSSAVTRSTIWKYSSRIPTAQRADRNRPRGRGTGSIRGPVPAMTWLMGMRSRALRRVSRPPARRYWRRGPSARSSCRMRPCPRSPRRSTARAAS